MTETQPTATETQPTVTDAPRRSGMLKAVGSTAIAKVLVMGVSGFLAIFTSRLIIGHFGTAAYAQYGLLATIPTLLPFSDLGVATVVINNIAGSSAPRTDEVVRRTIATAMRILIVSATLITTAAAVITLLGGWEWLLGAGLMENGGATAAFLCVVVFAVGLPITVGQRILVGLGRTSVSVASEAVVAPFILLSVSLAVTLAVSVGAYLSVFAYVGNALQSVICILVAARLLSPQLRLAIREAPRRREFPGVKVMPTAWPMLVQMLALPGFAMQTDRLLLSHLGTTDELASYNLAASLFGIVLATIATAGVALWPMFARARAEGRVESPVVPTLLFLAGGLVLAGGIALISPWLVDFVAGDKIAIDGWLLGSFVVFAALQASKYPVGMYMTDAQGLRFQVLPILLMVPVNLGVSWWLIGPLGAAGAILGSVVGVLVCQIVPNLLYVRFDLARRRRTKWVGATTSEPDV